MGFLPRRHGFMRMCRSAAPLKHILDADGGPVLDFQVCASFAHACVDSTPHLSRAAPLISHSLVTHSQNIILCKPPSFHSAHDDKEPTQTPWTQSLIRRRTQVRVFCSIPAYVYIPTAAGETAPRSNLFWPSFDLESRRHTRFTLCSS
eukprot:6192221-Pleurochrysis_carterae.AAC.8